MLLMCEFSEKTDLQVITRTYQWVYVGGFVLAYLCMQILTYPGNFVVASNQVRRSRDKSPFIGLFIFTLWTLPDGRVESRRVFILLRQKDI